MIVIDLQFVALTLLGNRTDGKNKDLKDLSCIWCKSYDAYPCFNEKTDRIIAARAKQSSIYRTAI
jgi:hypothetical protein